MSEGCHLFAKPSYGRKPNDNPFIFTKNTQSNSHRKLK